MTVELTREEQETIIRTNAERESWEIVTADPVWIRKLEKMGYARETRRNPADYVSFRIPYNAVTIRSASALNPERSEAQKAADQERALKLKGVKPGSQLSD